MLVKPILGKIVFIVVCVYAQQAGSNNVKGIFLDEMLLLFCELNEIVVLGNEVNGYVGKHAQGSEGVDSGHGHGRRNAEGKKMLEFGDGLNFIVWNTMFVKKVDWEHMNQLKSN